MRLVFSAVLLAALAVPDRQDPTPKYERPKPALQIYGDWHYVANGPDATPAPRMPHYIMRFLPAESHWISDGKLSEGNGLTARIAIDITKKPHTVDFHPRHGGAPLLGIFEIKGDRLWLSWGSDTARPADFKGPHSIHIFVRVQQ